MALEISCLETSMEVEALILWCSWGMGGSSWAPAAFPRCPEHPVSPAPSIPWCQEHPVVHRAQPRVQSIQTGPVVGSLL